MNDEKAPATLFRNDGYAVLKQAVSTETLQVYSRCCLLQQSNSDYYARGAKSLNRYADAFGESLLLSLQSTVERCTGFKLAPTYSYLRIYLPGAWLNRHTDRPSCEVSATLAVGYKADQLWPICVERQGQSRSILLDQGDMMVYMGSLVRHWREKWDFGGEYWIQLFLHYVIAGGELDEFKLDQRPAIGIPSAGSRSTTEWRYYLRSLLTTLNPLVHLRHRRYVARSHRRPVEPIKPSRNVNYVDIYKIPESCVIKIEIEWPRAFAQVFPFAPRGECWLGRRRVGVLFALPDGRTCLAAGHRVELFRDGETFFSSSYDIRIRFTEENVVRPNELIFLHKDGAWRAHRIVYPCLL